MGWLPKYEGEGIAACIPTAFLPWAPIDILVKLPLAVCLSTWRRKVEGLILGHVFFYSVYFHLMAYEES